MKTVVFTDLDATLLDAETYSWEAATEALDALKDRGASIVLVSSKTLAEMEPLHGELGLNDPFIVENGGGIVFSSQIAISEQLAALGHGIGTVSRGNLLMFPLGVRYEHLVTALAEVALETGIPLRGFAAMCVEDVASLTGLGIIEAERAKVRDFDEPFVIVEGSGKPEILVEESARKRGLTAVQGGRFWHLIGHEGKGKAVSLLIETYRRMYGSVITIGLGDSPNDYPFLELVDVPVVIGGAKTGLILPDSLRRARLTTESGPKGWSGAIIAFLSEQ